MLTCAQITDIIQYIKYIKSKREVTVLKRLICLFMCVFMFASVLPACAKTPEGQTHSSGIFTCNGFLYNVLEQTTKEYFLQTQPDFVSVNSTGDYIATGDIATDAAGNEYVVVIYGDLNCDGKIEAVDYMLSKRFVLDTVQLSAAAQEAAKSGDAKSAVDYMRIKRHVLKTFDLSTVPHRILTADNNGEKIAYIPLDNRPVNKDRVQYLAAAAGFELLIPEEDLYRTALDNMTPNKNGTTYGDREALRAWLKSVESTCDYYVISLDQMFSGGLVGSRWLSNTDLSLETEIADYLIDLAKRKHVVYFDTVMRLASTVGYQGYDSNDYNALRSYASIARKQLSGSSLTVSNIVSGYRYGTNGQTLRVNVSSSKLNQYLASRERKLRLIDYLLKNASEDIERLYVGVDDSSPQITIQTNEINYIRSIAPENFSLFAGADELGLMGIAAVTSVCYGQANCHVTYFGEGKDYAADSFDIETLSANVEKHLTSIGATVESTDPNALQVLVLTQSSSLSSNASKLVAQMKKNLDAGIPTCVVDASNNWGVLPQAMLAADCNLARLMGYSHWNTVGNAIGIGTSTAVARYLYLYHSESVTKSSNEAFLKSLTFSLVKDISYRWKGISSLTDSSTYGPATIVAKLNSSDIQIGRGKFVSHNNIRLSNFRYPWNRTFEATFDITV